MPQNEFLETIAEVYMRGGYFAISDEGVPLVIHGPYGLPASLTTACMPYCDQIRALVIEGARNALDDFLPTLDGLDRTEVQA